MSPSSLAHTDSSPLNSSAAPPAKATSGRRHEATSVRRALASLTESPKVTLPKPVIGMYIVSTSGRVSSRSALLLSTAVGPAAAAAEGSPAAPRHRGRGLGTVDGPDDPDDLLEDVARGQDRSKQAHARHSASRAAGTGCIPAMSAPGGPGRVAGQPPMADIGRAGWRKVVSSMPCPGRLVVMAASQRSAISASSAPPRKAARRSDSSRANRQLRTWPSAVSRTRSQSPQKAG